MLCIKCKLMYFKHWANRCRPWTFIFRSHFRSAWEVLIKSDSSWLKVAVPPLLIMMPLNAADLVLVCGQTVVCCSWIQPRNMICISWSKSFLFPPLSMQEEGLHKGCSCILLLTATKQVNSRRAKNCPSVLITYPSERFILKHWKHKRPIPIIQWTEELLVLPTFEQMMYRQQF